MRNQLLLGRKLQSSVGRVDRAGTACVQDVTDHQPQDGSAKTEFGGMGSLLHSSYWTDGTERRSQVMSAWRWKRRNRASRVRCG